MTRSVGRGAQLLLAACLSLSPLTAQGQGPPASLEEAVAMALDLHPALRMERARVGAARHAVSEARGGYLPQARVDAFGMRYQEPMVVSPLHGFDPQSPPLFDRTLMQFQASVGLTLLDGGLRRATVTRAEAGVLASEGQADATRAEVIQEVATAWLGVASSRETVAAQVARLDALTAEGDRVRQLVEVGRAAPLESLRVQAALEAAEAERIAAAEQLVASEEALARLLGQPVEVIRGAPIRPLRATAPLATRAALHAQVLAANPEVQAAAARVDQAEAFARAARSSRWPELRVVGGYTDYWSGEGRLTGEWQGGLRAGFPVFTGGTRRAATQRAAVEVEGSAASREALLLRLATALDRALAAEAGAVARVAALVTAVARYEEVVRIEQLALDAGAGTRRDWIAAVADLVGTRSALIAARHAHVVARLDLARLTGTLTTSSLPSLLEIEP